MERTACIAETVLTRHELAKVLCHARYHVVEEAEEDSASDFQSMAMFNCTLKKGHRPQSTAWNTDKDTCKGVRTGTSSRDTKWDGWGVPQFLENRTKIESDARTYSLLCPRTSSHFAQNENKEEDGRARERNCELVKTRYRERPMVRCKQWRFGCSLHFAASAIRGRKGARTVKSSRGHQTREGLHAAENDMVL